MCYLIKGKPAVLSWILHICSIPGFKWLRAPSPPCAKSTGLMLVMHIYKYSMLHYTALRNKEVIKREGLLVEKKNLLGFAVSLPGTITGGVRI